MQIFNTYSLGLAAWRRRECEGDNRRWQRGAPEPCLVQLCPSAPPLAPHPADRGQRLSSLLQLTNHVRGEITSGNPGISIVTVTHAAVRGLSWGVATSRPQPWFCRRQGAPRNRPPHWRLSENQTPFCAQPECLDGCFIIDQTRLYREPPWDEKNLKRLP